MDSSGNKNRKHVQYTQGFISLYESHRINDSKGNVKECVYDDDCRRPSFNVRDRRNAQFATKRDVIVMRSNASSSAPLPMSAMPWIAISTTSFTIAAQRKYLPPTARFVLYRER